MAEETKYVGAASTTAQRRLAYIDWMRGLACLAMFQTHCYDSWLSPEARSGSLYRYSQLLGTLPAPLFLFLCGVSFALVTERLWEKGRERDGIARQKARAQQRGISGDPPALNHKARSRQRLEGGERKGRAIKLMRPGG